MAKTWKEGVVPILKKREEKMVGEYKGVTLMPLLYKIYIAVLAERLREGTVMKEIIPDNQAGFRKGMGTLDNIYMLNYLINRQLDKKGGRLTALFVD